MFICLVRYKGIAFRPEVASFDLCRSLEVCLRSKSVKITEEINNRSYY